jgi:hypothetical protein
VSVVLWAVSLAVQLVVLHKQTKGNRDILKIVKIIEFFESICCQSGNILEKFYSIAHLLAGGLADQSAEWKVVLKADLSAPSRVGS